MRKERFVELVKVWAMVFNSHPQLGAYDSANLAVAMVARAMGIPTEKIPTDQTPQMSAEYFIRGFMNQGPMPEWATKV